LSISREPRAPCCRIRHESLVASRHCTTRNLGLYRGGRDSSRRHDDLSLSAGLWSVWRGLYVFRGAALAIVGGATVAATQDYRHAANAAPNAPLMRTPSSASDTLAAFTLKVRSPAESELWDCRPSPPVREAVVRSGCAAYAATGTAGPRRPRQHRHADAVSLNVAKEFSRRGHTCWSRSP